MRFAWAVLLLAAASAAFAQGEVNVVCSVPLPWCEALAVAYLRETGTTVNLNPYREMPDYAILGGAITYRRVVPGIDVQLSFENLFDGLYYDPSLRNPSGFPIAARIPQPGRAVYLQLRASR